MREEAGAAIEALGRRPGARIRRLWTGWRVAWDDVRVDYRGGLWGYATVARKGGAVVLRREALAPADEVLDAISRRSAPSG